MKTKQTPTDKLFDTISEMMFPGRMITLREGRRINKIVKHVMNNYDMPVVKPKTKNGTGLFDAKGKEIPWGTQAELKAIMTSTNKAVGPYRAFKTRGSK